MLDDASLNLPLFKGTCSLYPTRCGARVHYDKLVGIRGNGQTGVMGCKDELSRMLAHPQPLAYIIPD